MTKKILKMLFLCIITVSALLISSIAVNAALVGDVADNDNKITANDARLILRASVNLETLTDEQAAIGDTDENGKLSAVDARTILRMSVELDDIRHFYSKDIKSFPTCTEKGHYIATCTECDDVFEADIDALGHAWNVPAVTCTEDKYCTRENCTEPRTPKLGHTTDWGTCGNCKSFVTEKYAEQAATVKAKFTEAKNAFDQAYAINSYNSMLDGISWKCLPNTITAKPYYETAKAAFEAAYAACGDIPELSSIKALLAKNIENLKGSLNEVEKIINFCAGDPNKINANNYEELVIQLETYNAGAWNSDYKDYTTAINKKLETAIAW